MVMTDIHIRSFTGSGLKTWLHPIAKLRMEVFKDYPWFEEPNLDQQTESLRKIASCKESISVLIFDNTTLVGASLGYPLNIEEPALLRPFRDRQLEIDSYFYFGESTLLKHYRGRGIGHHFFDAREAHVAHFKKYKHICFCTPNCPESDSSRPKDFVSPVDFWRKRGYIHHPEMKCLLFWNTLEKAHPSEHQMSFWIRDLSTPIT